MSLLPELTPQCSSREWSVVDVDVISFRVLDDRFNQIAVCIGASTRWGERYNNPPCNASLAHVNMSGSDRVNPGNRDIPTYLTLTAVKCNCRRADTIKITLVRYAFCIHFRLAGQRGGEFATTVRSDARQSQRCEQDQNDI